MPIRTKYRGSISLMKELGVKDLDIWEEEGALQVKGRVKNSHDKMMIDQKIAEDNLDNASDINVMLDVEE